MPLLTVNVGSSSVRLVGYDARERAVVSEHLELAAGDPQHSQSNPHSEQHPLRALTARADLQPLEAIAHRVVHGGEALTSPCRIDAAVEAQIDALAELAPLHNPPALRWIRACRDARPDVPQIAVFDTAFFAALPAAARSYALPPELCRRHHVRRYGFHGLAHSYLWSRWQQLRVPGRGGRVISLQLGSGCSIAAIHEGAALDVSMGFSPLEGLVMGTRSGDLDPGLLLYLQRREGWSSEQAEHYLNERCGLLGLSGVSADIRQLESSSTTAAHDVLELFCYRARKYIGAYLAVLGGADAILFGGGIGEHSALVRAQILQGLQWAGIELDPERNAQARGSESRIGADHSRIDIHVVPVDESRILANEARAVLARG
ncbi:MAG TPA: acetate/propionate family kinase [Steroidobacteraceae bacterium]|nr:acetate/propionate family kinase [Steroidobacteraceae bacterium]